MCRVHTSISWTSIFEFWKWRLLGVLPVFVERYKTDRRYVGAREQLLCRHYTMDDAIVGGSKSLELCAPDLQTENLKITEKSRTSIRSWSLVWSIAIIGHMGVRRFASRKTGPKLWSGVVMCQRSLNFEIEIDPDIPTMESLGSWKFGPLLKCFCDAMRWSPVHSPIISFEKSTNYQAVHICTQSAVVYWLQWLTPI